MRIGHTCVVPKLEGAEDIGPAARAPEKVQQADDAQRDGACRRTDEPGRWTQARPDGAARNESTPHSEHRAEAKGRIERATLDEPDLRGVEPKRGSALGCLACRHRCIRRQAKPVERVERLVRTVGLRQQHEHEEGRHASTLSHDAESSEPRFLVALAFSRATSANSRAVSEPLVFDTSIEALYVRALGPRVTPALKHDLRALGLDLDKKLPPALPREAWYRGIDVTARHVFPALALDDAHREMGRLLISGMSDTTFGKALAPVVKLLGVRRVLGRVPHNIKTANTFATATLVDEGPGVLRLEVNDVGSAPGLMRGSLEGLMRWAGASSADVEVAQSAPPAASYRLRWSE